MFRGDGQFGGGPSPDEERQRVRDTVKGTLVSFVALCALIRLSKFGLESLDGDSTRSCFALCYHVSVQTNAHILFFFSFFHSSICIKQIAEPIAT